MVNIIIFLSLPGFRLNRNFIDILVHEDDYHPALCFTIESSNIKFLKTIKGPKRNFLKAQYDVINSELERIDWPAELNTNEIDEAIDKEKCTGEQNN